MEDLIFDEEDFQSVEDRNEGTRGPSDKENNDDILGLEKPIKLTHRIKIAKIDDDRILNKPNGIAEIVKNHNRVNRIIKRNDSKLASKLSTASSSSMKKKLKFQNEFDNLSSVLQFYQLWCHGIFPKANFKDCLKLMRAYGAKSSRMKLYRRELLDQEINKLKQANGMFVEGESSVPHAMQDDEPQQEEDDASIIAQPLATVSGTTAEPEEDDDWSFMNTSTRGRNALFLDDDDDDDEGLYRVPPTQAELSQSQDPSQTSQQPQTQPISQNNDNNNTNNNNANSTPNENNIDDDDNDPFSDDDDIFTSVPTKSNTTTEEYPPEGEFEDNEEQEYDNEMDIMREMGL
ncbi:chromosome segregation in meiosis protein 3 [[Candida] anglica]|uniref:Chromosome segregation in meiosis protein n=1 Tax=[Candida] anglica TaxID=148631 RepID=A0ABP0E869_9ASCO